MNRMIKVPATAAGLDAVEELAAAGLALNVTLIFSERQYKIARERVWKGAQRRKNGLQRFKSVYSIFVSRVDVYTENWKKYEIDAKIDIAKLEHTLMDEGTAKFADPHKALLKTITEKRGALVGAK